MSALALQLIKEAREKRLTKLDLGNCGLTEIPEEVFDLEWLEELNLGSHIYDFQFMQYFPSKNGGLINSIETISLKITELKNLRSLYLLQNQITDISFLQGLGNLTSLDLSDNKITDIRFLQGLRNLTSLDLRSNLITDIRFLQGLGNLTSLDLSDNKITDIRFLQGLRNLTSLDLRSNLITDIRFLQGLGNLTSLNLSDNKITDIRFLQGLRNLTSLDLSSNQITDILPVRTLIENSIPVKWENDYGEGIILEANPLTTPPPEIIKQGNEAVLNYFKELEERGAAYLYEAKLLVIGEGGAGKTTLARKIKDGNAPMPEEAETTKGISIETYSFQTAGGKDFQINIWDFGGQEIYHATHQFFLTKRSLYLLVDDTRKDDKTVNDASFNYWLQVVGLFGGESPLLIVQNEKGDRTKELDLKGMIGRFDFIKDRFGTNLLTGRGLEKLRDAIQYHITGLPHVGEKLPKNWVAIRKELEELAKAKDFISLDNYLAICSKHDVEEERAFFLSSYLHDLGSFLHFQDGSVLQNIFILNNQWATDAVYKVLDNEKVKKAYGRFSKADLNQIWCEAKYKHRHSELLTLMIKFELCYKLDDVADAWLAPQLLQVEEPKTEWDFSNNLIVRYLYDFMPKGLLSRFIVRMHQYIKSESLSWRSGVVLERQNTRALVTETYGSREIVINVKGSHPKELLTLIIEDFDNLHKKFETLKVKKLIPCNCAKCQEMKEPNFYEYEDLMIRKERGRRTVECKNSYEDVDVNSLLDGVFTKVKEEKETHVHSNNALKVFISYSHKDKILKEKLQQHLAALELTDKIIIWSDGKIQGGDEWDETIKKQLKEAHIILLLVSSTFIASRYIWNVEVKSAIERHNRDEAKVIPVFLRACDCKDMPFAKLQGFPENAKPVAKFSDRDEAFLQVAQGIRTVIENWKK